MDEGKGHLFPLLWNIQAEVWVNMQKHNPENREITLSWFIFGHYVKGVSWTHRRSILFQTSWIPIHYCHITPLPCRCKKPWML